jgi:hypothetical protein
MRLRNTDHLGSGDEKYYGTLVLEVTEKGHFLDTGIDGRIV